MSMPLFAQTTFYQNNQEQFYRESAPGRFYLPEGFYTSQSGQSLTVFEIDVLTGGDPCVNQEPPFFGKALWADEVTPCSPITSQAVFGPTITTTTILGSLKRVCQGPASVHFEFSGGPSGNGGSYDATMSYPFNFGRYGGCMVRALTGQVTLN
jgi:hypothetical protein